MSVNIYNTDNFPVPVKIIVEPRNSSRVSFGKKEIQNFANKLTNFN